MTRRPPDFISMACTTASVSYRESLTPEQLIHALLTGEVPQNRHAHFHVLLDEAPIKLLQGLVEQVGRQATYEQVAKSFERIASELTTCRDVRTWLNVAGTPPQR
jgi:hypothetical protein